jgi:hypothetical protein
MREPGKIDTVLSLDAAVGRIRILITGSSSVAEELDLLRAMLRPMSPSVSPAKVKEACMGIEKQMWSAKHCSVPCRAEPYDFYPLWPLTATKQCKDKQTIVGR